MAEIIALVRRNPLERALQIKPRSIARHLLAALLPLSDLLNACARSQEVEHLGGAFPEVRLKDQRLEIPERVPRWVVPDPSPAVDWLQALVAQRLVGCFPGEDLGSKLTVAGRLDNSGTLFIVDGAGGPKRFVYGEIYVRRDHDSG